MPTDYQNFSGFAYIDVENNPMAAWNTVRGAYFSPSCLPLAHERLGAISFATVQLLRSRSPARAASEFGLEDFRARHFPDAVSRLTGIFVFDDEECALRVIDHEGWTGGHFHLDNLTDVGVSAQRFSRLDSQWISRMMTQDHKLVRGWEELAAQYWSGEATSHTPLWECIIEGDVAIWGTAIKYRALDEIRRFWPQSLALLSISSNCAVLGSRDGAVIPYATRNGAVLKVDHYLRMTDVRQDKFCDQLDEFTTSGSDKVCRLPASQDLVLPDFQDYAFTRRITNSHLVWPEAQK